jgi:hypothetical protein
VNTRSVARGACFADYDNDGRVDAYLVNLGTRGSLLHNIAAGTGHWVAIQLKGARTANSKTGGNRDGIDARVEVWAGGREQLAERVASSGYLSQDDGRLHFGLGMASKVDKIVVHWPSGRETTLENQSVDRVLTVEEPQ